MTDTLTAPTDVAHAPAPEREIPPEFSLRISDDKVRVLLDCVSEGRSVTIAGDRPYFDPGR